MGLFADNLFAPGLFAPNLFSGVGAPPGDAPEILTTSLPDGFVGVPYLRTLQASGSLPITWDITVGALPAGLSLDPDTGEISGTPTTEEEQTFTVRATNGDGEDTQVLVLQIRILAVGSGTGWRRVGLGLGF